MPVELRWMADADLDQVMAIEQASFTHPWKRKFFESDLGRQSAYCRVARDAGEVVGYIVNWRVTDELHIADVAVRPEFRGRGIATALIAETISLARDLGCVRIFLEVRPTNVEALGLYRKFGFRTLHRRKSYYPDGAEAIVMERALAGDDAGEGIQAVERESAGESRVEPEID